MPSQQYILIVAYDGTRFHGFQRQYANNNTHNSSSSIEGMKKRPRIDKATGQRMPMVTADNKNVTVQECLECAILQWISTATTSSKKENGATKHKTTTASPAGAALPEDDVGKKQEEEEWSLETLNLRVAGRTDKGVHARGQVVAIQLPATVCKNVELWKIQKGIHGRLPIDISIRRIFTVDPCKPLFDPRKDAKLKQYSYTIKYQRLSTKKTNPSTGQQKQHLAAVGSQTFREALEDSPCLWLVHDPLDDTIMTHACEALQGTHDYSAFVHPKARSEKDNTLTVSRVEFTILQEYQPPSLYLHCDDSDMNASATTTDKEEQLQPVIVLGRFLVEGQRFRRTMVRNLVGFAVDVGKGKLSLEDPTTMESIWACTKEGAASVHAAPASGLCLEFVKY